VSPAQWAFQARREGRGDSEVLGYLRVGLCTAACMRARGFSASTTGAHAGTSSRVSVLGSYCSRPKEGNLPRHCDARKRAASEDQSFDRRARALFWLQKSARGVWLREATSVAAGVGDGGLARSEESPGGEMASRTRPAETREGGRACGGLLAGGRRPGPRKPTTFTGCWWNRSWFDDPRFLVGVHRMTGTSELRPLRVRDGE
jgi:hypothetical protein